MQGAVGLAAGGLFIGVGVGGGLVFTGALLRDGLKEGGETLGDRVKDGLKDGLAEGGAYIGLGAALSSSVAGLLAGAVACGARLLRASQAEPAGGNALPGPQCAGAA